MRELFRREVARVSVQQIPRRGHDSRAGDALDRRSDGRGADVRRRRSPRRRSPPGQRLPRKGTIFLSVSDRDKRHVVPLAKELAALGFKLIATRGTAAALRAGRRGG